MFKRIKIYIKLLLNKLQRKYLLWKLNKDYAAIEREYGLDQCIVEKMAKIMMYYDDISSTDVRQSLDGKTLFVDFPMYDNDLTLMLTSDGDDVGDMIFIKEPINFCKGIQKDFCSEEPRDLFSVGYELSTFPLHDDVAITMADVIVAWDADFYNFYSYNNGSHIVMMWELFENTYLFTQCQLDNPDTLTMYVKTDDTSETLQYIENNYAV